MATDSPSNFDDFEREALGHVPRLLAVARRLANNPAEAEDLVQDTLLKAIRSRDRYQPGTHLKAWLFKILRNTFINRYHRGQLERNVVGSAVPDPIADGWVSAASMRTLRDIEAGTLRPELREKLTAALDRIPEEFRMVVLLADVEEFSYREIAEALECPIGTVMSRLHRGRKLLRAQLIDVARDAGLLGPESFIGEEMSNNEPLDLETFREARALHGKQSKGGG